MICATVTGNAKIIVYAYILITIYSFVVWIPVVAIMVCSLQDSGKKQLAYITAISTNNWNYYFICISLS